MGPKIKPTAALMFPVRTSQAHGVRGVCRDGCGTRQQTGVLLKGGVLELGRELYCVVCGGGNAQGLEARVVFGNVVGGGERKAS